MYVKNIQKVEKCMLSFLYIFLKLGLDDYSIHFSLNFFNLLQFKKKNQTNHKSKNKKNRLNVSKKNREIGLT